VASVDPVGPFCERLHRAAAAHRCIGFNLAEDAAYFMARRDGDGLLLDGAARYRLKLRPCGAPPAGAFWSLCAYDAEHRLIAGPGGRPGLMSRDPLRFAADGSLDIGIQAEPPQAALQANWLAVQPGPFHLVLRVYWPGEKVLSGSWRPPVIQRLAADRRRPGLGRGADGLGASGLATGAGGFASFQSSGENRIALG
jgi:hypothetical protein